MGSSGLRSFRSVGTRLPPDSICRRWRRVAELLLPRVLVTADTGQRHVQICQRRAVEVLGLRLFDGRLSGPLKRVRVVFVFGCVERLAELSLLADAEKFF